MTLFERTARKLYREYLKEKLLAQGIKPCTVDGMSVNEAVNKFALQHKTTVLRTRIRLAEWETTP